jgi:hypothetical protein
MIIKCINPSEIAEGDLAAYLHGDATPDVIEHIVSCPFCAEQVEQLRVVDARLLDSFYRDACPAAEVLADFALNRLSGPEKLRVAAHVRDCAHCSEEAASVRDLADEEPPSLLGRLRKMLALALVVQPIAPTAVAARGEGWQRRFEVDDFVITLSAQAGSLTGRVRQRGTSAGTDCSGRAWLLDETEKTMRMEPVESRIDQSGRFQLTAQKASSCTLLLQIGEQNIALEMIELNG